ncbi:hypothetical protein PMIN06_002155 [Paraphaeosphaeria minitans]
MDQPTGSSRMPAQISGGLVYSSLLRLPYNVNEQDKRQDRPVKSNDTILVGETNKVSQIASMLTPISEPSPVRSKYITRSHHPCPEYEVDPSCCRSNMAFYYSIDELSTFDRELSRATLNAAYFGRHDPPLGLRT